MMDINPTQQDYERLMVFIGVQAIKEGVVTSPYSGTFRLGDYVCGLDFLNRCAGAWLETYFADAATTAGEVVDELLRKGYLSHDVIHNVFDFSSLNRVFNYILTTEMNVPDWGVLAWGRDGLGATYASSDILGTPFDQGVTYEQYVSQFPKHGITGSDIILAMTGANALPLMVGGWSPVIKDYIEAIRANLPPLTE